MRIETFDKIAAAVIVISVIFSIIVAITSWNWFPTPGDWGDIAHIPKSIINYIALLLPPTIVLLYLITRRWYFKKQF
jgi:hypothetical protein